MIKLVYQTKLGKLYLGDSFYLSDLISDCQLIIADPPYGQEYRQWEKNQVSLIGDSPNNLPHLEKIYERLSECMKNGYLFSFCSWKTYCKWEEIISRYFRIKNRILWIKDNWTAGDLYYQLGQQYEEIIFAVKGRPPPVKKRYSDVWYFRRTKHRDHPTQKPRGLIMRMLEIATNEGDLVVDPFSGSGTVPSACEAMGRRWIAAEIDENFANCIIERLKQLPLRRHSNGSGINTQNL
ncbi:site-specific DNA-methyltransferase [Candidatus Aerophobetes bacterium]|nr:site-specific DNA-methyltransferase [Candidatus Aerophobetes bacterium]